MPKPPIKQPVVDHRELPTVKQLMSEIGFKIYKINKDGEKEGIELEAGDYEQEISPTGEKVVIERKSDDFLSSVFSDRMDEQLAEIVDNDKIVAGFLIVDQTLDYLVGMAIEKGIPENVVYGTIASLCLKGFVPLFAGDMINFRRIVKLIFEKSRDGKDRIFRPKLRVGVGENILVFPGMNNELGLRLVKHFGSIKAVINATKEQLMEVHGIGKERAEKIIKMVN
jgi:Fanconi anemia group M protein